MQIAAKSSLTLMSLSSFNRRVGWVPTIEKPEINQQFSQAIIRRMHRRQSLTALAAELVAVADQAFPFRQMDAVEQASDILLNLPLPREFKSIANYYKGSCLYRRKQIVEARAMFEQAADEAPSKYKVRAMIALGTMALTRGDIRSALPFYIEGGRAVTRAREFDPLATYYLQSSLAIAKSVDGNHKDALTDLGDMFPLARAVGAHYMPLYYNHLNSLAVELLESGRITEAQHVSNIVLASPFADVYPEYRATGIDIALRGRRASRSFIYVAQYQLDAQNVLRLPTAERSNSDTSVEPTPACQPPARVLDMQEWMEKMGKEPNGDHKVSKSDKDMNQDEMLYEIMNIFTEKDMDREVRLKMLQSIRKLAAQQRASKPEKEPDEDSDQD